jgi:HEAT repeat protein
VTAPADSEATRLSGALVGAPAARQGALLENLRDGKGVEYTEALAAAIPKLTGAARGKARAALAERLARMKAATLAKYFQDEDAEIRRAAALACAMKDGQDQVPGLIRLLSDREPLVEQAAQAALKELTGQDFGPAAGASRADRARAIAAWQVWWNKQRGK